MASPDPLPRSDPRRNPAALLFDCDGTLVETLETYETAWRTTFAGHGFDMSRSWYLARAGLSPAALVAEALGSGPPDRTSAIVGRAVRHFVADVAAVRPVGHVAGIARQWHGRVPMAVVSGGPRVAVVAALANTGLLDLFDLVVTIEDVTAGKPAPDLYDLAVRRLAVPPHRCLAFEDTATGMIAARAARVPVIDIHRLQGPLA